MKAMMYDPLMLSAIKAADNFVICTHINPDGDALGSMLALGRLLRKMGKKVVMTTAEEVPENFSWLPDICLVIPAGNLGERQFDASFCVDVSEPARMGKAYSVYASAPVRFAVDHHSGTPENISHALIDPNAAAAGELIASLWEELEFPLDRDAAVQLYTAISTDTGNFCYSNVRAFTFACMERILRTGMDISEPSRRLFLIKSRTSAAARARALSSLKYYAGGRITCMHLTAEDKAETGARDADLHGMVNEALYLEGVSMTFMADEIPAGWKISLRSLPGGDVSGIAARFGGGGHKLAAGCVLQGSYPEIEAKLISAMEEDLDA